jgi:hypothetical protein
MESVSYIPCLWFSSFCCYFVYSSYSIVMRVLFALLDDTRPCCGNACCRRQHSLLCVIPSFVGIFVLGP